MNTSRVVLFLVFTFVFGKIDAQTLIAGKVLDKDENPLAYVSIGIPDANIGTYSFEDGSFEIFIKNTNLNDSIQFSHIGYKTKFILAGELVNMQSIYLETNTEQLDEVVIIRHNNKIKILGIVKKNSSSDISITKPSNGSEVAILIKTDTLPYVIEKINLNVVSKNLKDYSIRVKIYDVDESTGLPKNEITNQEIKGVFNVTRGGVCFYLDDTITINEPIYLSFEWLIAKEDALKMINANQMQKSQVLSKYNSSTCSDCSRVIHNDKIVNFYNNKRKLIKRTKLSKDDRKRIQTIKSRLPQLSFQTTKMNVPTYYRYTTFGKWYKYSQSLIASIQILN